ncbi:hypothetical protein P376_0452 [Streptomyces sp. HCCB10043]|nr:MULTISPECIES: hypothetical protein [Streptomyces]ESU51573.1 hypothetical protein P376_0452 [Streptomyces sp. HCCB10043]
MDDPQPVILHRIPVFTGDLALLDTKATELTGDGRGPPRPRATSMR